MEIRERGIAASRAYVERVGQRMLDTESITPPADIDFLGIDGDTLVGTIVYVVLSSDELPVVPESTLDASLEAVLDYRDSHSLECPEVRLDTISLLIIAEDRALLRHHRGARSA